MYECGSVAVALPEKFIPTGYYQAELEFLARVEEDAVHSTTQ